MCINSFSFFREPPKDCPLCPRLAQFRHEWQGKQPSWYNAPVPVFYPQDSAGAIKLMIVGLAPGLKGANRTGRPFTGDYAGLLLYNTLKLFDFAEGEFMERPDDSLKLKNTLIVNAVRCVPPQNKPTTQEIHTCRQFFSPLLEGLPQLRAVVTLGTIAHQTTIRALGAPLARHPFGHNRATDIKQLRIFSSYHCSRYNTNTGVLTTQMFHNVFANVKNFLQQTENIKPLPPRAKRLTDKEQSP